MTSPGRELRDFKRERDREIAEILPGKTAVPDHHRTLSAHDEDAVCEYISRIAALQEKVREKILIIPRIYTNKPRTTGTATRGCSTSPTTRRARTYRKG